MKYYKLKFKAKSSITNIPDSQTIFGAICQTIVNYKGSDFLHKYLNDDSKRFIVSDMFLNDKLVMPNISLFSARLSDEMKNATSFKIQKDKLSRLKKIGKISYISNDVFNKYVINTSNSINELGGKIINDLESKKLTVMNECLSLAGKEFASTNESLDVLEVRNKIKFEDDNDPFFRIKKYINKDSVFSIYLKTNDIDSLVEIFNLLVYTSMGPSRSVGINSFEYIGYEDVEFDNKSDYRYLLSKLILTKEEIIESINLDESNLIVKQLNYRNTRIASKEFEFKGSFVAILPGSVIKFKDLNREGSLIPLKFEDKTIYHNGLGYLV